MWFCKNIIFVYLYQTSRESLNLVYVERHYHFLLTNPSDSLITIFVTVLCFVKECLLSKAYSISTKSVYDLNNIQFYLWIPAKKDKRAP